MTNTTTAPSTNRGTDNDLHRDHRPARRLSSETKSSYKTSELLFYVLAVVGVLLASLVVDKTDFGAQEAWRYVTFLTIGYMVSRGLTKSGSRDFYDDDNR